ncbi:hypothetical protein NC652_011310 [Populus alba x Populus x berolinensis]|nr:hypothetical protein NC652_011310 [Populus alba x Populus x berolinensis]
MARETTGTSCWCRDEIGHKVVAEGYSAEVEACSAIMLIFGVVEIASEEEDCERAISGGCVDREGRPVSGVHGGLQAGGVRSGEGRREAYVQRESFD